MDPSTYMNIKARLAHYEQMRGQASSRPEVISLSTFLRGLLRQKIEEHRTTLMVPAQKLHG